MSHMNQSDWDEYMDVLNEWQKDAFQQPLTWKRHRDIIDPNGEAPIRSPEIIELKGLIQSNYFKSWPVTDTNSTGEIDKQSILVYFNIDYLIENGWADSNDYQFKFDPGYDKFIVNGLEYKPMGEAQAAQANNRPIFLFIILKREEVSTGEDKY